MSTILGTVWSWCCEYWNGCTIMGGTQSSALDDDNGPDLAQPVVPLNAPYTTYPSRSISQETRKALPVKNPFIFKFDETVMKTNEKRQKEFTATYTSEAPCKLIVYRHACPMGVNSLSDCSTPETVIADWELRGMTTLEVDTAAPVTLNVGSFPDEMNDHEIILINVSATVPNTQWTQWYYMRFEPFKSGEKGVYALIQWEEKMQIGKKIYSIMKIYSTKDDEARSPPLCLICSTDPCNTMVLPCRHLCLCRDCAAAIRMRDQKCPICRCTIDSMLRLDTQETLDTAKSPDEAAEESTVKNN